MNTFQCIHAWWVQVNDAPNSTNPQTWWFQVNDESFRELIWIYGSWWNLMRFRPLTARGVWIDAQPQKIQRAQWDFADKNQKKSPQTSSWTLLRARGQQTFFFKCTHATTALPETWTHMPSYVKKCCPELQGKLGAHTYNTSATSMWVLGLSNVLPIKYDYGWSSQMCPGDLLPFSVRLPGGSLVGMTHQFPIWK